MSFVKKIATTTSICATIYTAVSFSVQANPAEVRDHIDSAIAAPMRPVADRERDATRKPAAVLRFMGVKPGQAIIDMFSGGGYYSEILSYAVGPTGHVTAHNNGAYLSFAKEALETRYVDNRLPNVGKLLAEANDLALEPGKYDLAWMALTYHDFYYSNEGWPKVDVPHLLKVVYNGLKPGGVVALIDHRALAGSGHAVAQTLHRIDPAIVIKEMTTAGFVLDGESDLLANSNDPHDIPMWDPKIRGRTDRFVMRFKKPD